MRIGTGFDAHRFAENRHLVLGGVQIDYHLGLAGHSDADVLTHAVMDALLGARALGDIGMHFPDTDKQYKDACSVDLLKMLIDRYSMRIINIDSIVICQEPKLSPYIDNIRSNLSLYTGIETGRISVKATTTEMMGFTGRKEGIASLATVLME